MHIAILGLGEAGSIFGNDLVSLGVTVSGWDPAPKRKLDPALRFAKNNPDAVKNADIILSVNLSSASEDIAMELKPFLREGMIYAEMNTSSPEKKKNIYQTLKDTGVQFVDLAIMAPVPPKGILTPFLASGPGAHAIVNKLSWLNLDLTLLNNEVGAASTRKLLRSIVYKGIAAVICEAVDAGKAFGLEAYIREQISSVIGGNDSLIDRFLEGSYVHAERRMHEMDAVVDMLQEKNIEPLLSRATKENLAKLSAQKK
jgi:3-hydroxyisobutyrate dehydrogenase-like beta-hydroxyacid dehydrogenase